MVTIPETGLSHLLELSPAISVVTIPATGFVRLPQILAVIPVGKTVWWEGVRSGRYPKPVKLSARCTGWRAEDILELIAEISHGASFENREKRSDFDRAK